MDPKENKDQDTPKTPIKTRPPIYLSEDLHLITSHEKSAKLDLVEQILGEKSKAHLDHLLFYEKEIFPNSQGISPSQHSMDSDHSAQESQHSQKEKYETVRKGQKPKQILKDDQQQTTAKINKKRCTCTTKCLRKYCVCFKSGVICSEQCQCIGCQNTKITSQHLKNQKIALEFLSNKKSKGCTCKKKCLKGYCICHSNGRKCSDLCVCQDCHNTSDMEKDSFEDEKGVRLVFTARKKVKISEFDCGDYEQKSK